MRCKLNKDEDVDIFLTLFKEITASQNIVQGQ